MNEETLLQREEKQELFYRLVDLNERGKIHWECVEYIPISFMDKDMLEGKPAYLMSTEQTPVFFAAPKYPAMLSKLAKGRTESYGDSARGPTWQSHEQRFPAALQ